MFPFLSKFQKKVKKRKILDKSIIKYIELISLKIKKKTTINFSHSGHLGDIINSLPVIKEISKKKNCNLFIRVNKPTNLKIIDKTHPSGEFFLSHNGYSKILPLLKKQSYLKKVSLYSKKEIVDVNLDSFRNLPLNFNMDSIRWYSHITGVNPELDKPWISNLKKIKKFKNSIIIMRSLRRQNANISYKFLKKYKKVFFIGLYNEFVVLKKNLKNLMFHDCKDFLEMAEIINSCRLFIGNLSFGYALAEAIKTPRLLESNLDFPLVYPNGKKGYEFYFQRHFEIYVDKLIK